MALTSLNFKYFLKKELFRIRGIRSFFIKTGIEYIKPLNYKAYGSIGEHTIIETPVFLTNQSNIYLDDFTKIRRGFTLINHTGNFYLRKYSTIAPDCMVVTGNHAKTVNIPQIISGVNHINDKETDVIVENDVWIGARCTLLAGAHIGRGCVIGACSLVNKVIPPYAVAVGSPAKIIASTYTIEQILKHEKGLYPVEDRFTREELEQIFTTYYQGKKSIGIENTEETDNRMSLIAKKLGLQLYDSPNLKSPCK